MFGNCLVNRQRHSQGFAVQIRRNRIDNVFNVEHGVNKRRASAGERQSEPDFFIEQPTDGLSRDHFELVGPCVLRVVDHDVDKSL